VLLVDEIDKADVEVEGLLLEVLSDFQVTVPEMGTITAARRPFAVLTSNSTRELSEALKRRCLFLHLDFPDADLERASCSPGAGAGRAAGRRAGAHGAGAARAGAAQGAVGR
jgi:MoxR-like ATPase